MISWPNQNLDPGATIRLTVNKLTALRALRVYRQEGRVLPAARCCLPEPSPSPRRRWSARLVPIERLSLDRPPTAECRIDVVVPSARTRMQASFFSCTVRSRGAEEPEYVDLGGGLFIPCPELLFLELADCMSPHALALVGYELCGTYARSAAAPRLGETVFGLQPATSVARIGEFLDGRSDVPRVLLARHALARVADNAWSPMESILALMMRLPVHELGYGVDEIALNTRHDMAPELVDQGVRVSRVPDIEIVGTHVGLNYDGRGHLDLDSVARDARTGDAGLAMRAVREKHLDDLRRNRELAAQGKVVLPVTSEDLFAPGGLDALMREVVMVAREFDGLSMSSTRAALDSPNLSSDRQRLVWSLLPWTHGAHHARNMLERNPW